MVLHWRLRALAAAASVAAGAGVAAGSASAALVYAFPIPNLQNLAAKRRDADNEQKSAKIGKNLRWSAYTSPSMDKTL